MAHLQKEGSSSIIRKTVNDPTKCRSGLLSKRVSLFYYFYFYYLKGKHATSRHACSSHTTSHAGLQ